MGATAHGDVSALADAAILVSVGRIESDLIRGHATLSRDGIELLGTRRADLNLVRIDDTGSTPLGVNASQTRNLIALPTEATGTEALLYLGAPVSGATSYLPYQRVLIDLETGQAAGTFGISHVLPWRAESLNVAVRAFNDSADREREIILDASRSDDAVAVLLVDSNGDRRIALIRPQGVSMRSLCGRNRFVQPSARPATDHRVRSFALNEEGREENAPGRPIVMLHQKGAAAGDAVVYFHGGPGGTMADGFFTASVIDRLLTSDRDIIAVEYSGSQGGGLALTRRLADHGLRAIEEDVETLVRWLNRRNYRRVFVVGTSFGGVPALAAARDRERFDAIFFIAPLLRLREPEDWVQSTPIPAMPATHLAFELAYFGGIDGRRRFAGDLAALLATAQLQASDRFYFGARDRVSRDEDLPVGSPASHLTLAGTHHSNPRIGRDVG